MFGKLWTLLLTLLFIVRTIHVLGGQQQEKEEGQIRSSVAYELDEGFPDEEAVVALGSNQVEQRKEREEESDEHTGDELAGPVAASPA